jgi:hypothetical protein
MLVISHVIFSQKNNITPNTYFLLLDIKSSKSTDEPAAIGVAQ